MPIHGTCSAVPENGQAQERSGNCPPASPAKRCQRSRPVQPWARRGAGVLVYAIPMAGELGPGGWRCQQLLRDARLGETGAEQGARQEMHWVVSTYIRALPPPTQTYTFYEKVLSTV